MNKYNKNISKVVVFFALGVTAFEYTIKAFAWVMYQFIKIGTP